MGAGQFRDFVRIEKPEKVSDGGGGHQITWVLHCDEFAWIERVKSFRGDVERITGGGVGSHPIVRIHLHRNDLTEALLKQGSGWRIVDVNTEIVMNINFAQDLTGRGKTIIVTATENLSA